MGCYRNCNFHQRIHIRMLKAMVVSSKTRHTTCILNSLVIRTGIHLCEAGPEHPPLCDIPSGCCFYTGTRSSLRVLRRVAML